MGFNAIAAKSGNQDQGCPPSALAPHWHSDMLWFGPTGIGATGLTIERYQRQHQMPFRKNLYCKEFVSHISGDREAEMRVVDIYRRDGDKLAENWIFIDIPHYLLSRGLDVLGRMRELRTCGD